MKLFALLLAAALLVVGALVRAGGASLVRTSRADALHDAAEGDEGAARVARVLDADRSVIQPAIGTVMTVILVAAAVPASWALTQQLSGLALLAGLVGLGIAIVLIGDLLPRSLGRNRPRRLAYRFSGLLTLVIRLGSRAVDLVAEDEPDEPAEVEEVLQEEAERRLISSVLEFTDAVVREVMVPRTDMTIIAEAASTDEAIALCLKAGFSRIPVARAGPDDISGILYARDLLALADSGGDARAVGELMRSGYYVPETKRISELLGEMQANQVHMAVVVDEFGGTAGLVTIEDIIEELVGEIADEFDQAQELITAVDDGYLVDARLPVDELGILFDVAFPDEEWDTVGGLVLALAGRVPKEGEQFEHDGVLFVADRVQGRRVARVRCSRA
ncbi:MAG: HlyC/CorC family transporter [Acidimicrobiia bacterium]|nr:hemolysin family protein [Acidimicrobiia bacterium]NNF09056.1 HlyC/CorC family transporter [Acidimicrobiia bacterium]NNL71076.1 HlyC/CorC family transporter [Acidimicrobiia bacterium]